MKKVSSLLFTLLFLFTSFPFMAQTPLLSIGEASIDNLGIGKLMYRMDSNGGLVVDEAGMCFEMSLNYTAQNMAGKRLFCVVSALDKDGNGLADRVGSCSVITAENIPGANSNGTFHFVMPQPWLINNSTKEAQAIKLLVMLSTLEDGGSQVEKEITLSGEALKLDNTNLPGKLMGDLFGDVGVGDLIDGLFGGPSASSTQRCPACDGTRLCQSCDGEGFFEPASCRKCSNAPGICRRCKGTGEETIKVDFHDSLF